MSFALDLRQFADATREQIKIVPRKVALDVLRRVVMRTPVDQGRARGNWQTSVGAPVEQEIERFDKGGGQAIESGASVIEGWDAKEVAVFIMNNVPYIQALEDGHSKSQAPHGMVKITLAEFEQIVEAEAQ
jgi:hypothetical protein